MKRYSLKSVFVLLTMAFAAYIIAIACANRGAGPQGGPKDITPPHPIKSTPNLNTLNYKKNRIEIIFDEIIQVEKAFDNVIISPPQKQMPVVKALGKKLIVELKDTLIENTTYTIFFGDAIVDNNEKNPLSNYTFSFSTGDVIDSLKMSGTIIDASSLNPVAGILVGIHRDLADSAFRSKPFDRITKTDKKGNFTINNIKEGKYRIYALGDIGSNYKFDLPNEQIAFIDTTFIPTVEIKQKIDTIFRDSIVAQNGINDTLQIIDTIINRSTQMFFPDSIILKVFTEETTIQYLVKSERKDMQNFTLYFNAPNEQLPTIEAINFPFENQVLIQHNERRDTITYWLKDTMAWNTDTLKLKLTYLKTDSTQNLVNQTDTLSLRSLKKKPKNNKPQQKSRQQFLSVSTNGNSNFNFFDNIEINFDVPTTLDKTKQILLEQKVDTLWKKQTSNLEKIDSLGLKYILKTTLKPSETYRLTVDSAYFSDIYGHVNNKFTANISCKDKDSYASLTLEMGLFTGKEIVELLDKSEKVVRRVHVNTEKIKFENLDAGTYYARLFVDLNGNSKWDTGKFSENLQPEPVYYYPYNFQLRQMWDSEEYWDYKEFHILEQKPKELKKDENQNK
ncbi:MAG: Ig-like domain-containing protein [Porphyromonadaceae bacterium]|nr:Ig-like domain-containing protein [Porphyromonadaceae bacterium]